MTTESTTPLPATDMFAYPAETGLAVSAWDVSPMDNVVIPELGMIIYVTRIEIIADTYWFSGVVWGDPDGALDAHSFQRDDHVWIVWERDMSEMVNR